MHLVVEDPAEHGPNHETCGPTRVENVQEMRAVVWERGGDERVRNGFKCSIGVSKNKHAGVEHDVGIRTRGQTCKDGRDHVECGRGHEKFAVTNLIDYDSAYNTAETKTVIAHSTDRSPLS